VRHTERHNELRETLTVVHKIMASASVLLGAITVALLVERGLWFVEPRSEHRGRPATEPSERRRTPGVVTEPSTDEDPGSATVSHVLEAARKLGDIEP
jgi:hypothetical protein